MGLSSSRARHGGRPTGAASRWPRKRSIPIGCATSPEASGAGSGIPGDHVTPVDGSPIPGPPRVDYDEAVAAVAHACTEHAEWAKVDLDERRARVTAAVDALTEHRDLLALLLVWEIGKPWRLACADVDRCLDGVRWYVGEIERQLAWPATPGTAPPARDRCPTSPAGTTR